MLSIDNLSMTKLKKNTCREQTYVHEDSGYHSISTAKFEINRYQVAVCDLIK